MKTKNSNIGADFTAYAAGLAYAYSQTNSAALRKQRGQFFTSSQVGTLMAGLFNLNRTMIRLLDPGAGTGTLTASFCDRLRDRRTRVNLSIDAFESDPQILPLLKKTLDLIEKTMTADGHSVEYKIHQEDFILENAGYFKRDLFWGGQGRNYYDYIISNPPYFKLGKSSPQSQAMLDLVDGQPNIYTFFLALAASMLRPEGELVFITPRSFCSGLYYRRFREWLLKNVEIAHIHGFEARNELFKSDDVLQENIIIKARKVPNPNSSGTLTISMDHQYKKNSNGALKVPFSEIISISNGHNFIRVPSSQSDVGIIRMVDRWPHNLKDFGLEVSTGPVVAFRAEEFLRDTARDDSDSVPLIWMHNLIGMEVKWPVPKSRKPEAIMRSAGSRALLVPLKNYVLIKRFSSKEQKRRLYAAVLQKDSLPYDLIGIENHVNYVHRPKSSLSKEEAFGIAGLLNSRIIDRYFRALNGNTQVNATEIRGLPLPSMETILEIGTELLKGRSGQGKIDIDDLTESVINVADQKLVFAQER